jgi:uncharacterized protein (TIGR03437 family)
VDGSGFFTPARILWNGSALDTTWIDSGHLRASVPAAMIAQAGAAAITVAAVGGVSSPVSLAVRPAGPFTTTAGIVNAASGSTNIAPGSLVAIFGTNLSSGTDSAAATPLPLSLAGTSVTVDGIAAPLVYVSPSQINLQMPFEVAPGSASVIITSGTASGDAVAAQVIPCGPGIVMVPQSNHALAVNFTDGSLNSATNPAHPGDYLILYLTGQGALDNPVATGTAAPSAPFSRAIGEVSVRIGGQPANVVFAGLAPGLVGVFQINLAVPAVAAGEQPLLVSIAGSAANPAVISVQ